MFCTACGKELNSNNVCVNNACPSYINNNQNNSNINNNNTNSSSNNDFTDKNGITTTEMITFLGEKNTEYYFDKWMEHQEKANFISWNWPAFLFKSSWFLYRKMYGIAAILIAIDVVLQVSLILLSSLTMTIFSYFPIIPIVGVIILLLIRIGFALAANQLYIKHAISKITPIKYTTSLGFNVNFYYQKVRSKGGTSWIGPIIFMILSFQSFLRILFFISAYLLN